MSIPQDPKTLNPLLAGDTQTIAIDRFLFEPLLSADSFGNPFPMLVDRVPTMANGGISKDGLTITYHLRGGMKWSDGVAVTSDDVKWSWQAIMNPNNNAVSRHGYDDVASIDTPDVLTAVVHLRERFGPFVNTFFAESDQPYDVMPKHALARYANVNEIPFNNHPDVTDGPFVLQEWQHGDHISLTANNQFFLGKPHLRGINIAVVGNENTAANLLRTHALDYFFQPSINTYPSLSTIPDTRVLFVNMNGYEGVLFNTQRPLVRDVRVRRAIAYIIDKPQLVKTLTYGQEQAATEDLPSWMWAFDPSVPPYPHDPRAAQQLLKDAGWTRGPDGILRNGAQRMSLTLIVSISNAASRKLAVELQAMLAQAGIEVAVHAYPEDILYAPAGAGGILHGGKFDIDVSPWFAGIDPDDSSQFMCKYVPPVGYNDTRYCNPQMDAAQERALTSYDVATRKAAYAQIQSLLYRDVPALFIWWQRDQEAVSDRFKGFAPNPTVETWNAWQWSI